MPINFLNAPKITGDVTVGADTSGYDVVFYGDATGEKMQWDESESKLRIWHDTDDTGVEIFTVASAATASAQLMVGRNTAEYWGVYTVDRTAHLVHRQDETTGTMWTAFDQWDSNTSDTTGYWAWRSGNGSGGSMSTALELTQGGNAVLTGTLTINDITAVGSDTNKFLMSDSGVVKFATGAEVLSYIGAGTGSGSVTSVGITAGTGISVSGSPVTGSGSITVTNTAPATIDGSGAANQVAYWSDSDTLTGDADLTFDGTDLTCGSDVIIEGQLQFNSNDGATCTPVDWLTYLCPDTGTSVNSKIGYLQTNFPDNSKVTFGDASGGDLEIYSDGTDGILYAKVDDLVLKAEDDVYIQTAGGEDSIIAAGNGGVRLFYDTSEKLETTNTGVDITGGFTTSASSSCAGLNMTADISMAGNDVVLDSNGNIELDTSLTTSQTSGTIIKHGGHMSALTAGKVYYGYASMTAMYWAQASQSSATSAKSFLAMSIGTDADVDGMLLSGVFYSSSHGFTIGTALYLSTSGNLTNTIPSTSNYYARVCGYALDANHIYFNPDNTWVKID